MTQTIKYRVIPTKRSVSGLRSYFCSEAEAIKIKETGKANFVVAVNMHWDDMLCPAKVEKITTIVEDF